MMSDEQRALAGLRRCRPIQLELSPDQAFCLVATIQLALRHPGNRGPTSKVAEAIGRALQDGLAAQDAELGRLCERGWHPVFDVPREHRDRSTLPGPGRE